MNIVVFGSGPMPCEPCFPVLAPGARTWQIVQTVACALSTEAGPHRIAVYALEPTPRERAGPVAGSISATNGDFPGEISYVPCSYDDFVALAGAKPPERFSIPDKVDAVVGCASIQPCATAAEFAASRSVPVWIDLFGDPIAEIQSKAELHPDQQEENDRLYLHVWRLLLKALHHGDAFSALSERQREAVIGQLGPAGRLGRRTRGEHLVSTIPFALFPGDFPPVVSDEPSEEGGTFTVMWCGSFNTWMDVDALVEGVTGALRQEPRLRLLVVGGRIPNYNEESFDRFVEGIRTSGVEGAVEFLDWCSLEETRRLYARCDAGLSIDRFTYEALLGSRTRIVNFLAAGRPVLSTVITELTEELAREGYVLPFRAGDGADLARALVEAARMGRSGARELGARGRRYVEERFAGGRAGRPLADWIRAPRFARDKDPEGRHFDDNPLIGFWKRVGV